MKPSRFVVGIDLGTTHTALAYVDTAAESPEVTRFDLPQLVAPGTVENRPALPSFLYLPSHAEMAPSALSLPWPAPRQEFAVGELARAHGWKVPMRLVSSAKSWLCHSGVDRTAPLLPFSAPDEVPKVSPVEASARYLGHLRAAWNHLIAKGDGSLLLEGQEVFVTVPASFDAVARELTVQAATSAGLGHVTLLEEPQAAFYSWLGRRGEAWRGELTVGDVILVCDIGGGTTDFTLIAVAESEGSLTLERVAVGDHILLGGDNMDLALAHRVRAQLEAEGHKLDNWQMNSLVHACRHAKEQLFEKGDLHAAPVAVLGRGSKVIGGSIKGEVLRADLESLLLDGFFPIVDAAARPRAARRVGLRELGLPFAEDAAVTRHLAKFVDAHGRRPTTAVLFNGGVMKAGPLRQRVVDTLGSWTASLDSTEDSTASSAGHGLKVLSGTDLDLAVAEGAAYYGLVRRGRGVRIRGGTARAYYVGIESALPAVPGIAPPLKALCVAPFGMEEGSEAVVHNQEFGLVIGEPAEFRFLSSTTRRDDQAGSLLEELDASVVELAPVATTLGDPESTSSGSVVPVELSSRVTEVGTLELWLNERGGDRRFKLEFNVREVPEGMK
jgi:molecular chaperone DnaK (HSP70)